MSLEILYQKLKDGININKNIRIAEGFADSTYDKILCFFEVAEIAIENCLLKKSTDSVSITGRTEIHGICRFKELPV